MSGEPVVALVAGVDSSTQSCTVMLRDAVDGRPAAIASAPHPRTTPPISEQHPDAWWRALKSALEQVDAGSVAAISVDGQGHGLVALDANHDVIRPAKLWNDTTSAAEAAELVDRLGAAEWARRVGSVPTAAFTITKLLWLARHEPANFAKVAAVLLPHDWLLFRLTDRFRTDRTEASGTGYFSPAESAWQRDLLSLVGREAWHPELPDVLGPDESAGVVTARAAQELGLTAGIPVGPGCNDNPASALALGIRDGDVVISLGTSGTVFARSRLAVADPTGTVDGNADPTGAFLPLVCTLNATKVTDAFGRVLGVDHDALAELALSSAPDEERPVLVPYLDGERTPNRPRARGVLAGIRSDITRAQLARSAYEGVIWGLLDGLEALDRLGVATDGRLIVTGGGARSPAYRQLLADLSGRPVYASSITETAAAGAAVQAAAVLQGRTTAEVASSWAPELPVVALPRPGQASRELRDRFHRVAATEILDDLA
jgi:xylulokinase